MVEEVSFQVLTDRGFYAREGDHKNLTVCNCGEQNQRMVVESVFSLCKRLLGLNNIVAKTRQGFELALASIFTLFNLLLEMNKRLGLFTQSSAIAHFFCL